MYLICLYGGASLAELRKVGMPEAVGKLQSVANSSIHTDVREPDRRELRQHGIPREQAVGRQPRREYVGVDQVVGCSPKRRSGDIADRADIGREQ